MTTQNTKKFTRKEYLKLMRKIKGVAIFAAFAAFFFGLLTTRDIINIPYIHFENYLPEHLPPLSDILWQQNIKGFLLSNISAFLTYFIPAYIVGFIFYNRFTSDEEDEIWRKGAMLIQPKQLVKLIKQELKNKGEKVYLYLSKYKIPFSSKKVSQNFFILGQTGAGKTRVIFDILEQGLKDKNANAIIYDRKPDFYERYWRENKDYLFKPDDERTIKWGIFKDLVEENGEIDKKLIKYVAQSILPAKNEGGGNSDFFAKQAQGVLQAVLVKVASMPKPSNKLLIDFLLANGEGLRLRNALINDPIVKRKGLDKAVLNALTVGSGGLDNQGNSVMATFNEVIRSLCIEEFYTTYEEENFSIKQFIKEIDKGEGKRLFIVNTADNAGAYSMYFSLFISLFFRYSRKIKQDMDRKTFLVLDEIASLGEEGQEAIGNQIIKQLNSFTNESRSYGYSVIVGAQALSQFEEIVDKKVMRTLFQNLSTKILMQYSEAEGIKFFSEILDTEVEQQRESYTQTAKVADFTQDRLQEQSNIQIKKLLLSNEFTSLKELEAFIVITGMPISKVKFDFVNPKTINEKHISRTLKEFDTDTIDKIASYYQKKAKEAQIKEALKQQKENQQLKQKMREML